MSTMATRPSTRRRSSGTSRGRARRAGLAGLVAVLALSGCSQVEDAARGAVDEATCSAAERALDGVRDGASSAIDRIDVDPQAARRQLEGLRSTVRAAQTAVEGELGDELTRAGDALDALVERARESARGVEVDTTAVDQARGRLGTAVDDARALC